VPLGFWGCMAQEGGLWIGGIDSGTTGLQGWTDFKQSKKLICSGEIGKEGEDRAEQNLRENLFFFMNTGGRGCGKCHDMEVRN